MAFGAPDWLASRWPLRPTMGTNQARYLITGAAAVAAGGTAALDIVVPAAYNLVISAITVASPVSCINYMYIQIAAVTYYWKYWDMNGDAFFPQDAAPVIPGGVTATIVFQNNDTAVQTMRLSVAGTYEEI